MTTIKYLRRNSLGNYSHEEFEISLPVDSTDKKVIFTKGEEVKDLVLELLGLKEVKIAEKVTKSKKEEVAVAPKPEAVIEVAKVEEVVKEEEVKEEVVKEEVKVEVKKEKKVKAEKAPKASKTTIYDRELDTHKALIGRWLDSDFKQWQDPTNLPKFGKASRSLSGKAEFLDEAGEILESFKDQFKELVSA